MKQKMLHLAISISILFITACSLLDPIEITYRVSYAGNGNTSGTVPVDQAEYPSRAFVTVLGNTGGLAKTGYAFTGWNTKADGSGIPYAQGDGFAMGEADVTLYAAFGATYHVTYHGNGNTEGTVPSDGNAYPEGAQVTVEGNIGSLAKAEYAFAGWNTESDGSGTGYSGGETSWMGTDDMTLFAVWTQSFTFAVRYDGNGSGSGSVPVDGNNYLGGSTVTILDNTGALALAVHAFAGWNTEADGSGIIYAAGSRFVMSGASVILYAMWSDASTVTYIGNGNTGGLVPVDANSYLAQTTAIVLGNTDSLSRTGYSFSGWNTMADGSGTRRIAGSTFSMGASNVILYAQWSALYSVSYDDNGSSGAYPVPTDTNGYLAGVALVTVLDNTGGLEKTGYTFAGWTTNPDTTGPSASYTAGATFSMGAANVTLYAVWIPSNLVFSSAGMSIVINGPIAGSVPNGALAIPAGVTSVGSHAFFNCQDLTSIALPSSVTSIEDAAFWQCSRLTSLSIPLSVTSVGNYAFTNCRSLMSVSIPSSVTSIGNYAFENCVSLTSVAIPSSVTFIGTRAFAWCHSLTGFSVDSANPTYKSSSGFLFNKAETTLIQAPGSIAGSYAIPSNVISIGEAAFNYSYSLTSIAIPSSVTSIGGEAFNWCTELQSITVDPSNPCYASLSGVLFNKALTVLIQAPAAMGGDYAIPSSVTSIEIGAFIWCYRLSSVSIPSGVASIGEEAFWRCYGLTDITIPSSVTSIGNYAFGYCDYLKNVTMVSSTPPRLSASSDAFVRSADATPFQIHVPSDAAVIAYGSATGWRDYSAMIITP